MESAGDWCLIESDPGVFTQLIKKFGVKGVQVEEMWTFDDSIFDNLRPVHGLIFLFKYLQHDEPPHPVVKDNRLEKIYFAKQVINNACATQAVVSLLLNCNHPDVILGPELTKLKEFSMSFDPRMRGLTLSNSQTIRSAHNSMSQQALFEFDPKVPTKDEDAYHFIGYMPIDGRLYELDGLREGPIDHGPIAPEQDWLDVVRPIIVSRINVYTEGEIHFNLMALVSDRKMIYERQIQALMSETRMLGMETDDVDVEIRRLRMLIEYEDAKMLRYNQEMLRRRHNYLPFIITLLKILAEEKKLSPLLEKAKERALKKGPKKVKSSPSRVLPPSEHMQYSLADLDSIFREPQEPPSQLEPQDVLQQSLLEPPADMDMLATDDFLKDVVLDTGFEHDLIDVHDIFDENMIPTEEFPHDDILDPDELLIRDYMRNPGNEEERDAE
ncbi:26S proteasome regulatory complex subunit p37A [Danaus plexippus plexippus]|uniref:Ubiquitin carboxyl-terminal hydrolase n=1 Tax=Danaus plexippus plexippus TaxID=278856 RepID=A0A212EQG4_DANPL|nr:26S proteasome regulatory complex subunit p37A [Danaus plexippus plexippus]